MLEPDDMIAAERLAQAMDRRGRDPVLVDVAELETLRDELRAAYRENERLANELLHRTVERDEARTAVPEPWW
jgi:hypothetical protein